MASRFVGFILIISVLVSCNTSRKVAYFENVQDAAFKSNLATVEAPIQANDILTITISSLNPEASAIFNPSSNSVTRIASATGTETIAGGYLVNPEGNIQLPIIGNVVAARLTKNY